MNLSPGGKQIPQNDTIYPPESSVDVRGQSQRLWTENETGQRVAKGIERILKERGCYPEGKKIKAKCTKPRCPDPAAYPPPADQPPCCLARILQNHKDFREQESAIASAIKGRGHKCLFLPKDTLDIFEQKHLGCVAVLVFDQSSAHNSHGSGALNAFGDCCNGCRHCDNS